MNNTDKLLRAFIEASGFEIEEIEDYQERKINKVQASKYFSPRPYGSDKAIRVLVTKPGVQAYLIDDNGMYTETLSSPNIDYKVTKSKANTKSRHCVICNKESTIPHSDFCDILGCSGRLK